MSERVDSLSRAARNQKKYKYRNINQNSIITLWRYELSILTVTLNEIGKTSGKKVLKQACWYELGGKSTSKCQVLGARDQCRSRPDNAEGFNFLYLAPSLPSSTTHLFNHLPCILPGLFNFPFLSVSRVSLLPLRTSVNFVKHHFLLTLIHLLSLPVFPANLFPPRSCFPSLKFFLDLPNLHT